MQQTSVANATRMAFRPGMDSADAKARRPPMPRRVDRRVPRKVRRHPHPKAPALRIRFHRFSNG